MVELIEFGMEHPCGIKLFLPSTLNMLPRLICRRSPSSEYKRTVHRALWLRYAKPLA